MARAVVFKCFPVLCLALVLTGCLHRSIKEEDRPLLITAKDLESYGAVVPETHAFESMKRIHYADRSVEIDYEYEAPDDMEGIDPMYLTVTIEFEPTLSEAKSMYTLGKGAYAVGSKIGGLEVVEQEDFFQWGDASFFSVLEYEGQPVGNLFITRKGKKIYTIMLSGLYFDDAALWRELVEPRLNYMTTYEP
jgi:hypothetical protein